MKKGILKVCPSGHRFYKSSDCPVCPVCEKLRNSTGNWLQLLAAPARRAIENAGIKTPEKLSSLTQKELLALHGMGKASLPILKSILKAQGLEFKS